MYLIFDMLKSYAHCNIDHSQGSLRMRNVFTCLLDSGEDEGVVVSVSICSDSKTNLLWSRVLLEGLHQAEYGVRWSLFNVCPP